MLSLEIIAVLGFFYCFLMFAMLRTQWAKREAREKPKVREIPLTSRRVVREKVASTSSPTESKA